MVIHLLCVGDKMPAWVKQGYEEYAKRLNKDVRLKLIEIELPKRSKNNSAKNLKLEEAKKIQKYLGKSGYLVSLDVKGKSISTENLASKIDNWLHLGKDVYLLIGGPDGLDEALIKNSNELISISNLTFPHPLVRIIVAEQLYRAWSLLNNHPYHRE